jgi:hypothetical protein
MGKLEHCSPREFNDLKSLRANAEGYLERLEPHLR